MLIDLYAHRFCDDPEAMNEIVDEGYEDALAEMEAEAAASAAARAAATPPDLETASEESFG